MARVEQSIDVNVPLSAVYNQWTQFEQFPRFMDGVREVRQLDDAHLHWRAHRHGREVEWDSEIVEQVPDQSIQWRDTSGPHHSGSIRFSSLDAGRTRIHMSMEFDAASGGGASGPTELAERLGQDLERFKDWMESQGHESGAWRGEIHHAQSTASSSTGHSSAAGMAGASAMAGERTVGQTASEARAGASSHPRWEAWDDESAFGTNTASGEMPGAEGTGGSAGHAAGGSPGGTGARGSGGFGGAGSAGASGSERGRGPGRDKARFGPGSAQEWLRNQFPNLNEPMGVVRRMTEEMDQLFERFVGRPMAARFGQAQGGMAGKWMPQVEVVQLEDALLVCADLPGIKREDVQVEVMHDRLVLEGERHEETRGTTREGFRRSERCYGRFYRMIPLPHGVDPDSAQARMQDGVLEVRIPMPAATRKGRRVDIG